MKRFVAFGVNYNHVRVVILVCKEVDLEACLYGESLTTAWATPILAFIEIVQPSLPFNLS